MLPAQFSAINGAKLWIKVGGFSIQPGEFAKIALLVFFAYYLVRKREVLSLASKRFLGIDFPRGRDLGPVRGRLAAVSLMVLIFEKDLGTSLMYFGMFVVTLYIATERVSWLIIGLLLFFGGAFLAYFLGDSIGGPFAQLLRARDDLARPVRRRRRQRLPTRPVAARAGHRRPVRRRAGCRASPTLRCPRCRTTSSSPAWARRSGCSG